MKKLIIVGLFVMVVGGYIFSQKIMTFFFRPTLLQEKIGVIKNEIKPLDLEVVAQDLKIPWDIVFLPDGDMLVTERPGNLIKIGQERVTNLISNVSHAGEGGLLGITLHPDFNQNGFLYLYLTTKVGEGLINRVERYRFVDDKLFDKKIIIDNIPGATFHDGGKLAFGPDGYLYITTGDAGQAELAQDLSSLSGKVLRLRDDGSILPDNPFGTKVYSYGHRNSQSLVWDEQGRLWSTEHGRSGIKSGLDELNLIQPGKNYGWPVVEGDNSDPAMIDPVIHSGADITWAPAGAAYWQGSIFFGGLRGESLYEADISSGAVNLKSHFFKDYGRIRAVVLGPDGYLYISTSNTDGRGQVRNGDDKIIKINPEIFR